MEKTCATCVYPGYGSTCDPCVACSKWSKWAPKETCETCKHDACEPSQKPCKNCYEESMWEAKEEHMREAGEPIDLSKPPVELIDLGYLMYMAQRMGDGANRPERKANDWKGVHYATALKKHKAKIIRHLYKFERAESSLEKMHHAAAIGCNAMILWWHASQKRENEK